MPETALETSPRTGRYRHDIYRPASRVLAKKRSLRTADHFGPLNVEQVGLKRKRRRHVDAIQMEGDRGIRNCVLVRFVSDTANGDYRPKSLIFGYIHARCQMRSGPPTYRHEGLPAGLCRNTEMDCETSFSGSILFSAVTMISSILRCGFLG